ncbi:ATP-binding protein [Kitasatospora cheerisanensis]|uniref:Putative regulatory protein n=1 Tax=Kitasatospora cheerisanensis KCTC 2395 TaxID=1348663 RepID=A0A066Z5L4_9ACTN|nr:ATP-binding protein [Kitasatospora cheerisanensis]KDN87544.1 putative regulatory protein [Kitasatospora cheerisanensis KCTC 2395]
MNRPAAEDRTESDRTDDRAESHGSGQDRAEDRHRAGDDRAEDRGEDRTERRSLALDTAPGAVARSREFTRLALLAWGWLPARDADGRAAAEDVLLMASELVTNACQHASGPYALELTCCGPLLRIAVRDRDDRLPVLRAAHTPARPGGHGLRVVDRLAAAWGSDPVPGGGKRVWLETLRPPAEP